MLSRVRAFVMAISHRFRMEAAMDEELRFHMEAHAEDLVRSGLTRREAERQAAIAFGAVVAVKQDCRRALGLRLFDEFAQDIRYAARGLRRNPGFGAAVALTLSLGTGATTAVFSVADEALFRPLPVPQAERLVNIFALDRKAGRYVSSSFPDYEEFRQRTTTLEHLSAYVRFQVNATVRERTDRVQIEAVTGNYFSMLRLNPIKGRVFRDTDDSAAAEPVALIHEEYWQRVFDNDPAALGKTILIEDRPFTVVGIVPRRFRGPNLNWQEPPQVWIPLRAAASVVPPFANLFNLRAPWLVMIGRLNPNYTAHQADVEFKTIAAGLAHAEPGTNRDLTAVVLGASESKFWPAYRNEIGQSIGIFALASVLVLLLACANISNLQLARALARRREFAVRVALGAAHMRLVRQILTESLLLAVPGCLVGFVIALGLQAILIRVPNAFGLPLALDLTMNDRMGVFSTAITGTAVLLFGLFPALRATRSDAATSLKESGNALSPGGDGWLRNGLVVAQICFAAILLTGGGLFARDLLRSYSIDPGLPMDHLLTATFGTPTNPALLGGFRRAQTELEQRLSDLPTVESAALARENLLSPVQGSIPVESQESGPILLQRNFVDPGFFHTVGIDIVSGRGFPTNRATGQQTFAVVNGTLAARARHGSDPVGMLMKMQGASIEIIGVARDAKYGSLWEEPKPYIYLPLSPEGPPPNYLMVRTRVAPEQMAPLIRREWERIGSHAPMYDFRTGEDLLNASLAPQRVAAGGIGAFGILALLLASLGLYSVLAYSVKQRTRELAIRAAVGARPGVVIWNVMRRSLVLAAAGGVIGIALGAAVMRVLVTRLSGLSMEGGVVFSSVAALLACMSITASLLPAFRASRINPGSALRGE
ncbi:MAG TPA: ABC transporter permease [Bryobacteraceae bacterium]|jgi:predicted permease|nr:ABC transporter permease [Bryobacteraceae bacterium]